MINPYFHECKVVCPIYTKSRVVYGRRKILYIVYPLLIWYGQCMNHTPTVAFYLPLLHSASFFYQRKYEFIFIFSLLLSGLSISTLERCLLIAYKVAMILINFLSTILKERNLDEWSKFYLSYDNM